VNLKDPPKPFGLGSQLNGSRGHTDAHGVTSLTNHFTKSNCFYVGDALSIDKALKPSSSMESSNRRHLRRWL